MAVDDTVWNYDARQVDAISKRVGADYRDAVAHRDVRQAIAIIKGIIADIGNTVWNRDAGREGVIRKRVSSDASDQQPIDGVWNAHRTGIAGISRDGDGNTVSIGDVIKLSLHHNG